MLDLENPEDILQWDIAKLWAAVQIQLHDAELKKAYEEDLLIAKMGIYEDLHYPIEYIINEWYDTYPENKRTHIYGHFKMPMDKFLQDVQERENILRNILLEIIETGGEPTKPRVEG